MAALKSKRSKARLTPQATQDAVETGAEDTPAPQAASASMRLVAGVLG
jgi:hypothetical protein